MMISQSQTGIATNPSVDSTNEPCSKKRADWHRIAKTSTDCLAVSLSLLCFPKWLPWMVAFWLACSTICVVRRKPGYFPLATCAVLLLVRTPPPTPMMLLLVIAVIGAAIWRFPRWRTHSSSHGVTAIGVSLFWIAWAFMVWEYRSAEVSNRRVVMDLNRPIVCIGDSLTQGMIPDPGYPGQLKSLVRVPVVNKGVSGVSTAPAIGIVERAMRLKPQVVVIELGGHDFLKWHSRSSTKANLTRMIEICHANDAEVVLMEIPRGFMVDPYMSLERELAYEHDLQLVDDRWLRHVVLMSPIAPPGRWLTKARQLSNDGIHSNEKGSRRIAEFVCEALVNLYGKEVLRAAE